MAKKKSDKKIECFSAAFNDILICQRNDARPFIEAFVEDPENITQQNLGVLAGILEITDSSEDSSYIVNYLISVIKKEYYSRPKRGVIESFESALRKANLALAKLAEHENIAWIGHTNAILLVIEKNNLHLSQSGSARALLLRGKTLTDLSDGGVAPVSPNPLKTFTDIVSGRLEENDKLIVTTDAMMELFSLEEIKRSALRFSSAEFLQFLKTALVNEAEHAAALIIEIRKEEKMPQKTATTKSSDNFNAFSQSAFSKRTTPKMLPETPLGIAAETFSGGAEETTRANGTAVSSGERAALVNEIKEELAKNNDEFVDKKTGHIYIKGNSSPEEASNFLETMDLWQDKFNAYASSSVEVFKTLREKSRALKMPVVSKIKKPASPVSESAAERRRPEPEELARPEISGRIPAKTKAEEIQAQLLIFWKENYPKVKNFSLLMMSRLIHILKNIFARVVQKTKDAWTAIRTFQTERQKNKEESKKISSLRVPLAPLAAPSEKKDWMEKYSAKLSPNASTVSMAAPTKHAAAASENILAKIKPDLSRLKNLLAKMDYTQRIYAALAIVCLFVVPYFLAKIGAKPQAKIPVSQEAPLVAAPLGQDKNVTQVEKIKSVYAGQNITSIINLNDAMYAVSTTGVIDVKNNASYPFPAGFSPLQSAGMDDLNFIFILGQSNRILAWSPIAKAFQENSIAIPSDAQVVSIGAYLTYLYVLDSAHAQLYRYPRVTNGFGNAASWLKNADDAAGVTTMAVSDNIYLAGGNGLLKFLQGKKQNFTLETSATPIKADALFTKRNDQFVYILDKTNARVVKIDLNGQIIAQYYNAAIAQASGFTVDEKNNAAYFSTAGGVSMFGMN